MGAKELVMEMKLEAEKVVAKHDAVLAALEVDLKLAEDKGFDLGLAQAGVPASDKIYTEADLKAEVLKASELAKQQAEAGVGLKVSEAVLAKQAEMVKDFEAAQVDDSAFLAKYKV